MTTFKEANFRSKLDALSESQQSIQTLCHWVVFHRKAANESAAVWAQERKRAPTISWRWHDVCNIRKTWVTQS